MYTYKSTLHHNPEEHLKQKCHCIIEVKIKEGIFVGAQIKELIRDNAFHRAVNDSERRSCNELKAVTQKVLGCHWSPWLQIITGHLSGKPTISLTNMNDSNCISNIYVK
jgi:hypothetical protein